MALALLSIVHAARGPSSLAAMVVADYGAGGEWKPRPGRPDAAGARGWASDGWEAGRVPGVPWAIRGPGDGRQPGIRQRGLWPAARGPGHVAVKPQLRSRVGGAPEGATARHVRTLDNPGPPSR